MSKLTEVEGT